MDSLVEEDLVSIHVKSDEFGEVPDNREQLESGLRKTQAVAYAKGLVKNLFCQWRSFYRFYKKYKLREWPVSAHTLALYAQYLAHTFHSVKLVRNYLSGVCTLHILTKVVPPSLKDIEVCLILRGLNKLMPSPVKQAHPLTPEILLDIANFLNLAKLRDLVFWAILLVGFFGMLRKSNLIPDSKRGFDAKKQLSRGHVSFRGGAAILSIMWSKTLQFRNRVLEIPLLPIPHSPLCPVTVLKVLLDRTKWKKGTPSVRNKRLAYIHICAVPKQV